MYREMKTEDALREYLKGRKVVLMEVIQMSDEVVQHQGTELKDVFDGSMFLVDVPDESGREQKKPAGEGAPPGTGKKKWFLNTEDKDRVREKYLAGMEISRRI